MSETTEGSAPSKRPEQVSAAVYLLYASLALGLVRSLFFPDAGAPRSQVLFKVFVSAITFALSLIIIYKIGSGRNWARMVFAALCVLGLAATLLAADPHQAYGGVFIVQAVSHALALVLLFLKPSSAWFRNMKKPGA